MGFVESIQPDIESFDIKSDDEENEVSSTMSRRQFLTGLSLTGAAALATACTPKFLSEGTNETQTLLGEPLRNLEGLELTESFELNYVFPKRNIEILNYSELTINREAFDTYMKYFLLVAESGYSFQYDDVPGANINYQVVPELGDSSADIKIMILPRGVHPRPEIMDEDRAYTIMHNAEALVVIPVNPDIPKDEALAQSHNGLLTELGQITLSVTPAIEYTNKIEADAFLNGLFGAPDDYSATLLGKEVLCNSISTSLKNNIGQELQPNNQKISDVIITDPVKNVQLHLIDIPQPLIDRMPPTSTPRLFK